MCIHKIQKNTKLKDTKYEQEAPRAIPGNTKQTKIPFDMIHKLNTWGDLLIKVPLPVGGAKIREHHFADYLMHFEMIYSHF